jgi:hypothetical protein
MGLIAFGAWIEFAAARASSGSLLVWTILRLMPAAVGLFSLFAEMRNGTQTTSELKILKKTLQGFDRGQACVQLSGRMTISRDLTSVRRSLAPWSLLANWLRNT